MKDLKRRQFELLPIERSAVPADVIELVEKAGPITSMKRFHARNWFKNIDSGFAFIIDNERVMVIQESCVLYQAGKEVPAWGVFYTDSTNGDSLAHVVEGLFCHNEIKVGFSAYNIPVQAKPLTTGTLQRATHTTYTRTFHESKKPHVG